jgi:hypothetical protein
MYYVKNIAMKGHCYLIMKGQKNNRKIRRLKKY